MALTLGTNCGFVSTAPTADPAGSNSIIDGQGIALRDTSPSTAIRIVEVGWWCDTASEAANFEVGLYAADGAIVPNEAGTRLFVEAINAKGTTAGWKVVSGLNWTISSSTTYWIAIQCDAVDTTTNDNQNVSGGSGFDKQLLSNLPNPWGSGTIDDTDGIAAVYAVWEASVEEPASKININDVWQTVSGSGVVKININDVWQTVSAIKINIGDSWQSVKIS